MGSNLDAGRVYLCLDLGYEFLDKTLTCLFATADYLTLTLSVSRFLGGHRFHVSRVLGALAPDLVMEMESICCPFVKNVQLESNLVTRS
jgi:hypothetical protein